MYISYENLYIKGLYFLKSGIKIANFYGINILFQ